MRGERPEASHWGMHHAREQGCELQSSSDIETGPVLELLRRVGQRLFKVDLAHLLANRKRIAKADAIWAMSERELVLLGLLNRFRRQRPLLVGEVVWLLDEWPNLGFLRRGFMRFCLAGTDALLVCVEGAVPELQRILPATRILPYRFGIPVEAFRPRGRNRASDRSLRVLVAGNDLRRDWWTVIEALDGDPAFETVLLSRREHVRELARAARTVRHEPAGPFRILREWYCWADVVVIASLPNNHGAGLTMLLEAAAAGVPIVAARTGFLDEYLPADSVAYVPPSDPRALREALNDVAADPGSARLRAERALERVAELTSENAVTARLDIIRRLLAQR